MTAAPQAELAAGNASILIVKVGGADRPPGALTEDLQGAGGEAVDVDPAHKPHSPLLSCTNGGAEPVQMLALHIQTVNCTEA